MYVLEKRKEGHYVISGNSEFAYMFVWKLSDSVCTCQRRWWAMEMTTTWMMFQLIGCVDIGDCVCVRT